ncbi:hypothetical protein PG985_012829 [Apiospora marii]|uniref:uncharacterized protein n=1 Tax=Apiospora marii TaxID=335849 RepID=UPI003131074B
MMALISASMWIRESGSRDEGVVSSNGGHILAITGALMGITFVVVSLRLYVRQMLLKSFSIDDAVIIVALIMAIMSMVCFVGMVQHGAGRYQTDIKDERREGLAYWTYILGFFLVTGICLVKISIGFLLKRFAQSPGQHRFLLGMILFLFVFMVYSTITFSISCAPLRANWVPALRAAPTTKCQSKEVLSIIGTVNGVINALTEIIFCLLPVPVLLALRINRRTRVTLFLILSLGLFACAASVARIVFGRQRLKDPDDTSIELQVGILAASLPTLRPLFTKLLKGAPRTVLPGGSYSYEISRHGCGGPPIPLDSVVMPRHCDGVDSEYHNGPRSYYYQAQVSSSSHVRHLADDDSEKVIVLPPGGIHVLQRTDIMYNADKECAVEEIGERR